MKAKPVVCNRADATICAECPHAHPHRQIDEHDLGPGQMCPDEEFCPLHEEMVQCIPADRED